MISPVIGLQFDAADLLEVGELRHFHAVQPHFPAQAPGAERRVLPIVLDEAHVVLLQVEAERFQRAEVQIEDVGAARASARPGTGNSAAGGSGFCRSGRPWGGAMGCT